MELLVTIYQDEDGVYIADCLAVPGCVSQGTTKEEALANLQEAFRECVETRKEKGLPAVVDSLEVDFPVNEVFEKAVLKSARKERRAEARKRKGQTK
jgi:predicted RNase H-like HicB family nuclease